MNFKSCPNEKEVRELVARGGWPFAAEPDLRDHVLSCRSCSDLVLVSVAFKKARADSLAAAKPGAAGALWWRAQLRRRNAALERISRPLLGAEIFALAVSVLTGLGFTVFEARNGVAWLSWLEGVPENAALHWDNLRASMLADPSWSWAVLVPAAATLALLGGVAVYLATDRQ
jgi:hypothetical protein